MLFFLTFINENVTNTMFFLVAVSEPDMVLQRWFWFKSYSTTLCKSSKIKYQVSSKECEKILVFILVTIGCSTGYSMKK